LGGETRTHNRAIPVVHIDGQQFGVFEEILVVPRGDRRGDDGDGSPVGRQNRVTGRQREHRLLHGSAEVETAYDPTSEEK
jgi:hypothetical protein